MIFIKKAKNRAILTWQFFNGLMYHDLAYAKMSEVQLLYQIMENQKTANKIIQTAAAGIKAYLQDAFY